MDIIKLKFHTLPDISESCGNPESKGLQVLDFLLWTGEVAVKLEERGEGMINLRLKQKIREGLWEKKW